MCVCGGGARECGCPPGDLADILLLLLLLSEVTVDAAQLSPGTALLNFQVKIPGCFSEGRMSIGFRVAVWNDEWFSLCN